jgi:hypothetical protein
MSRRWHEAQLERCDLGLNGNPIISCPCQASETEKEVNSVRVWHIGEHRVHFMERFDKFGPKLPIALPFVVIRSHDPSIDVLLPCSYEKIRKQSLQLKLKTRHELSLSFIQTLDFRRCLHIMQNPGDWRVPYMPLHLFRCCPEHGSLCQWGGRVFKM